MSGVLNYTIDILQNTILGTQTLEVTIIFNV